MHMGDTPEFIVELNLDKATYKQWMWTLRINPINVQAPEFHEHSISGDLGNLAAHVRMMKNLGSKLHLRRGFEVVSTFDNEWKNFILNATA